MAGDYAICTQIREFLTAPFVGRRHVRLGFSYNGKNYTTVFTVGHNEDEIRLVNNNKCINVGYNYETASFVTDIHADSGGCFTPRLTSNSRGVAGVRTTSLDVLTVLMTKLCTCFPSSITTPIIITDMATKDDISLSAFHLIRGGNAIYEKYGYTSPSSTELKERIRNMRWRDLDTTTKQLILQIFQENGLPGFFRNGDLLVNILQPITYKIEQEFNRRHLDVPVNGGNDIESINFSEYMLIYLTKDGGYNTDFILDTSSVEWNDWSSRLLFTEFEEIVAGGIGGTRKKRSRKTRRRRRVFSV
jgi:hypothetical protein